MKIKFKKLLLIMFTLSIMFLRLDSVVASPPDYNSAYRRIIPSSNIKEVLYGGQTYYIANRPKSDAYPSGIAYQCVANNNTGSGIISATSGEQGCIIKVNKFSGKPIETSIDINVFDGYGYPGDTITQKLELRPYLKSTRKTEVGVKEILHSKSASYCSFSMSTQKYSYEGGPSTPPLATTELNGGKCIFKANSPGTYIVYSKCGIYHEWTITVLAKTNTSTLDTKSGKGAAKDAANQNEKENPPAAAKKADTSADSKKDDKPADSKKADKPADSKKADTPAATINIPVSKTTQAIDFTPGYRFVTNLVTGTSLTCGDKVYISSCDGPGSDSSSKCTISERNGVKPNTKLTVNRIALSINEPTDCEKTVRYSKEATAFTNSNLSEGKLLIPCGAEVVFEELPYKACNFGDKISNLGIELGYQYCEVVYDGKTVYVDRKGLTTNKPSDSVCNKTCVSSESLLDQTSTEEKSIKICYKNTSNKLTSVGKYDEFSLFKCAKGYKRIMKEDPIYNTCSELISSKSDGNCSKVFIYSCASTAKPTLKGSGNLVRSDGKGMLTFKGFDSVTQTGLKGYFIYTNEIPTISTPVTPFDNSNYEASLDLSPGIYFVSVITNDNAISYPLALSIYSDDISTTAQIKLGSPDGKNIYLVDGVNGTGPTAYNTGITFNKYALLSNKLNNDSILASGFDLFTTAYEVNVEADKIAVFATLTSSDATFVEGYGPRTVDLDYGKNTILVKIINDQGKERTYTFIVNRKDDRANDNLLSDLKPSVGNISFDPYVSDYTIVVPKNTKTVSLNATLESVTSAFVSGFEPRIISLDNDITSAVIRTASEAGITRNYVLTFVKTGADASSDINSAYLSSLTIPGTEIMFDKEISSYNVSVEYEIDSVDVYAFAESSEANVSVEGNSNLSVGSNRIEIVVTNESVSKVYSVYMNRKEDSLGVSNNTKLNTLTIKDYDLFFDPDVEDYTVKIKREKTLLITATPVSNRSQVYMEGNNDLTAYSTVKVKVIAENGDTGLYSIDIVKDLYNAEFETTAAIIGAVVVVGAIILIGVYKRRKSLKEYVEE